MSNFLYYLAAFGLVLGILIVVHEFGHYAVARLCGVKVLRFSIGFGRPLWRRRFGRDETEWVIAAFPLGGYVKMVDEREGEVPEADRPRAFNRQTVGKRSAIVVAGPLANFVLAILIYWGLFWYGTEELAPVLGTPPAASVAAAAGVANGERVMKIGGEAVETWQDLRWELLKRGVAGESIDLEVIDPQGRIANRHLDATALAGSGWDSETIERLGVVFYRPAMKPVVGKLVEGGIAAAAGLRAGDEIVKIDGVAVDAWASVVQAVRSSPGKALALEVRRGETSLALSLTPEDIDERGRRVGRIGATVRDDGLPRPELTTMVSYDPLRALGKAAAETWDKSVFTLKMLGKMLIGDVSWHNISGPVAIADYAGQSAKLGWTYYLKFLALVSISLGVLNLLPIPILDGGHLLYHTAEVLKRGPISERALEIGQQIGLTLLLILMAFAFYNDINRLISG